jgi:hypothetical protein
MNLLLTVSLIGLWRCPLAKAQQVKAPPPLPGFTAVGSSGTTFTAVINPNI